MIVTIDTNRAQVIWQEDEDEDSMLEKAIFVTNYPASGLIELKQGKAEIDVNYESIPELMRAMKAVKGMHD